MSVVAMTWVFEHSEATLGARLVLLALADHAHPDGTRSFPSVATLAAHTRMTRRAVQAALRKLEDEGHIRVTGTTRSGTTVYAIVGMGGEDSTPREDTAQGGVVHDMGGVATAPNVSSTTPDPSPNRQRTRQDPSDQLVAELFEYWQEKCNHRDAKLSAERRRKIAARLREGFTPEQVRKAIDGAAAKPFVNDGRRFDDIELICRNASKLESFIERAGSAGPGGLPDVMPADRRITAWLEKHGLDDVPLDAVYLAANECAAQRLPVTPANLRTTLNELVVA